MTELIWRHPFLGLVAIYTLILVVFSWMPS